MQRVLIVILLGASCALLAFSGSGNPDEMKLNPASHHAIRVLEPSDLVEDPASGHLFIVSDKGLLWECDAAGATIRRALQKGTDFEGIDLRNDTLFVSDETERRVYLYGAKTLDFIGSVSVPYSGGRNAGYESITWNGYKNCFLLITEKDPVIIQECDAQLRYTSQTQFHGARDISGARYAAGYLWLLSDEDHCILRCNPATYAVEQRISIPVLNPEGIAFTANGRQLLIAADDLQQLFYFPMPQAAASIQK